MGAQELAALRRVDRIGARGEDDRATAEATDPAAHVPGTPTRPVRPDRSNLWGELSTAEGGAQDHTRVWHHEEGRPDRR